MPTNRQPPRRRGRYGRAGARGTEATSFTPHASAFRRAVERRSAVPLLALRGVPRWTMPVAMAALLLVGLAAPRWIGVLALVSLATFLTWLCYLSWPALQARGRVLRTAAILVLCAAAAGQGVGAL